MGSEPGDYRLWRERGICILTVDAVQPAALQKTDSMPDHLGRVVTLRASPAYVGPLALYKGQRAYQAYDLASAEAAAEWHAQVAGLDLLHDGEPLYHLVRRAAVGMGSGVRCHPNCPLPHTGPA